MFNIDNKLKLAIDLFMNTRITPFEVYQLSGLEDEISIEEFYEYLSNYKDENGNKIKKRPHPIVKQEYKDLIKKLKAQRQEKLTEIEEKKKQEDLSKAGFIETVIYNMRCDGLSYRTIAKELEKEFKLYISHESIRKICGEAFKERNQNEKEVISRIKAKEKKDNHKEDKGFVVGRNIYKYIPEEELYEAKKRGMTYMEITEYLKTRNINVCPKTVATRCNRIYAKKGESIPSLRKGSLNYKRKLVKQENLINMVYDIAKKRKANKQQLEIFIEEVSKMYKIKIDIDNERDR